LGLLEEVFLQVGGRSCQPAKCQSTEGRNAYINIIIIIDSTNICLVLCHCCLDNRKGLWSVKFSYQ